MYGRNNGAGSPIGAFGDDVVFYCVMAGVGSSVNNYHTHPEHSRLPDAPSVEISVAMAFASPVKQF